MRTEDGLELYVRAEGPVDAPLTVVFSHGWTEDHDFWRYQVRDLRERFGHDIRLVAYDLRGHGRSDATSLAGATIEHLACDLSDIIDIYAPQGDLVLVGHSLGGMTIMELCDFRPDLFEQRVVGVLLVNTSAGDLHEVTLGFPRTGHWMKAQIAKVLWMRAKLLTRRQRIKAPVIESMVARKYLFGDNWRLRDHMLVVESLINCPPSTMRGFFDDMMRHQRLGHVERLAGIPTLILAGEKDQLTPLEHSRTLAAAIPGCRLIISPGCGHMMPLERDEHVSQQLIEMVSKPLERRMDAATRATTPALQPAASR